MMNFFLMNRRKITSVLTILMIFLSVLSIVAGSLSLAYADTEDPFAAAGSTIEGLAKSAIDMLKKILLPLGSVTILVSVLGMYLPGQSQKNVERLKVVVYATIGAMILVGAVGAIMDMAKGLGETIGEGLTESTTTTGSTT